MPKLTEPRMIRIPVRIQDGQVKFFYGSDLPALENGAIGDLLLPEWALTNQYRVHLLQRAETINFENAGATLRAHVRNPHPEVLTTYQRTMLQKTDESKPLIDGYFVELTLDEDLLITLRGTKTAELSACHCRIPSLGRRADSINQAYTLISQEFEPQRRSHTGNVFDKVYFPDREGKQWQPLSVQRDRLEAQAEYEMAVLWQPWYLKKELYSPARWAYIEESGEPAVKLYEIDASSTIIGTITSFDSKEEAQSSMKENHYHLFEGEPMGLMPPTPPYRTYSGEIVYLKYPITGKVRAGIYAVDHQPALFPNR